MILSKFKILFEGGEYEKAFNLINSALEQPDLKTTERISLISLQAEIKEQQGKYPESLTYYMEANKLAKQHNETDLSFSVSSKMAFLHIRLGDIDTSESLNDQLLAVAQEISDSEPKSKIYNTKGIIYYIKGEMDPALQWFEQALKIREKSRDQLNVAHSLTNIGNVHWELGDLDQSVKFYERSLAIYEAFNNQQDIADTLNNIANVYYKKSKFEDALNYNFNALKIRQRLDNHENIAISLNNISIVYGDTGQYSLAIDYGRQSLDIYIEIQNEKHIASVENNIGTFYYDLGVYEKALGYYLSSLKTRRMLGNKYEIAYSLHNLGIINSQLGEFQKSVNAFSEALEIFREFSNPLDTTKTLFNLFIIYYNRKENTEAEKYGLELLEQHKSSDYRIIEFRVTLTKALLLYSKERLGEKMQAMEILRDLSRQEDVNLKLSLIAILHYIEIIFLEIKMFGSENAINEARSLIQRVVELSGNESKILVIDLLSLESRLNLLEGDLVGANDLLHEAKKITDALGLNEIGAQLDIQLEELENELNTWKRLLSQNASLNEMMEQSRFDEYLQRAKLLATQ